MPARSGFALVEAMVAMVIIVIGALALATTLAGGAIINARTTDRQQALALAAQEIDRLRSLPYKEVGLAPISGTNSDAGRSHADWREDYCPLPDGTASTGGPVSGCNNPEAGGFGGLIITLNDASGINFAKPGEPRRAKRVQTGSVAPNNSYLENGLILYSYIYWPDQASIDRGRKVISVVVRFRDRSDGTSDEAFGTVRLSAVVVDNPGLGQIPEPPA